MALGLVGLIVVVKSVVGSGVVIRRWDLMQRKEIDAATAKVFMGVKNGKEGIEEKSNRERRGAR